MKPFSINCATAAVRRKEVDTVVGLWMARGDMGEGRGEGRLR
jgi:hypothetical protein